MFRFCLLLAFISLPMSTVVSAHEAPSTSEEKLAYIRDHVVFLETTAKRIDTYSEEDVPAVRVGLKNIGGETLTDVHVRVYFLDDNGLPFAEKDLYPINAYGDFKELKPNYSYRQEDGKYFIVEHLGDEWSGETKWEILDIGFAE